MLIKKHSGLVYNQLRKFYLNDDPEAESIGFEALYNALLNYDESKGTAFSTVATVYIYNALGCYLRSLNAKRKIQTISYNNLVSSDSGETHEFVELLASGEDPECAYIDKDLCAQAMKCFDETYDKLTNEKHKAIVGLWREYEFDIQTKEIAKQLDISQSYVSQVLNMFRGTMKKKLESVYYGQNS